jgi:hypothetical protein
MHPQPLSSLWRGALWGAVAHGHAATRVGARVILRLGCGCPCATVPRMQWETDGPPMVQAAPTAIACGDRRVGVLSPTQSTNNLHSIPTVSPLLTPITSHNVLLLQSLQRFPAKAYTIENK